MACELAAVVGWGWRAEVLLQGEEREAIAVPERVGFRRVEEVMSGLWLASGRSRDSCACSCCCFLTELSWVLPDALWPSDFS